MALTFNNFWHWKSGGLEEVSSVVNIPSVGGTAPDYYVECRNASEIHLNLVESVADAGGDQMVGFNYQSVADTDGGATYNLISVYDSSDQRCWAILRSTNNTFYIYDRSAYKNQITAATVNAASRIDVVWSKSATASGTIKVYIDKILRAIVTGANTDWGTALGTVRLGSGQTATIAPSLNDDIS